MDLWSPRPGPDGAFSPRVLGVINVRRPDEERRRSPAHLSRNPPRGTPAPPPIPVPYTGDVATNKHGEREKNPSALISKAYLQRSFLSGRSPEERTLEQAVSPSDELYYSPFIIIKARGRASAPMPSVYGSRFRLLLATVWVVFETTPRVFMCTRDLPRAFSLLHSLAWTAKLKNRWAPE